MPVSGKRITVQQIKLFMDERKLGKTQVVAAAKTGLSEHSARRIDHSELTTGPNPGMPRCILLACQRFIVFISMMYSR